MSLQPPGIWSVLTAPTTATPAIISDVLQIIVEKNAMLFFFWLLALGAAFGSVVTLLCITKDKNAAAVRGYLLGRLEADMPQRTSADLLDVISSSHFDAQLEVAHKLADSKPDSKPDSKSDSKPPAKAETTAHGAVGRQA